MFGSSSFLDRRVREPKDLEELYGLPLLGVVPESQALSRSAKGKKNAGAPLPASEAGLAGAVVGGRFAASDDRPGAADVALPSGAFTNMCSYGLLEVFGRSSPARRRSAPGFVLPGLGRAWRSVVTSRS